MLIVEKLITKIWIGPLCKLFGKFSQAFYDRKYYCSFKKQEEIVVLEIVSQVKRELPRLSGHKLYKCIYHSLHYRRKCGFKIHRTIQSRDDKDVGRERPERV